MEKLTTRNTAKVLSDDKQQMELQEMVLTLVNPIIELAKRNIEHNAKKNDKFLDIYHTMEYL